MTLLNRIFPLFLLALIILAGCKKDEYNFNDLPDTVKSFFTVSGTEFDIDEEIQFTNQSENGESFFWDFGDGTKSTENSPVKSYSASGTYTVSLKTIGPGGTGNYSTTITIKAESQDEGGSKDLYFIEYGPKAIKTISVAGGTSAELLSDIAGKAGVGLAYDSVDNKIYFSDFDTENDGKIWRMDLDGSNMEELVSGITDPYSIALNLTGGKIYWADDAGNVGRANLDGSNVERQFIHVAEGQMRGIAYDSKNDIIYFYEVDQEVLYAAKSNGSGVVKLVTGAYGYSIFVDEVNDKLYYEDRRKSGIMQMNLDGSDAVKIAEAPGTRIHGMAIDYTENKFYWADRDNGVIKRANLDGTETEDFLPGLSSPRGIFMK